MSETQFRDRLGKLLKDKLGKYQIHTKQSIIYKVIIDSLGYFEPAKPNDPKRGQYAFQTDLLISNDKIPLVVIEVKFGGFSTHDVLTYSTKALKHKEVYPYLRYGLIIGGRDKIDRKFFIHNSGFDFAIAIENLDSELADLVEVVEKQISLAELMSGVLKGKKIKKYVANIEYE